MFLAGITAFLQGLILSNILIDSVSSQKCNVDQYCNSECKSKNAKPFTLNGWKEDILVENMAQYCKTGICGIPNERTTNADPSFVCQDESPPPLEGMAKPDENPHLLCKPGQVCGPRCHELNDTDEWGKDLASFYVSSFFKPGCNPLNNNNGIASCKLSKAGADSAQKVLDDFGTYSITGHCRFYSQSKIVPIAYGCEERSRCDKACTRIPRPNKKFLHWYYPESPEWSYHIPLFEDNCNPKLEKTDCQLSAAGVNLTRKVLHKLGSHCESGHCKYISKRDLTPLCVNSTPKTSRSHDVKQKTHLEDEVDFWIESNGNLSKVSNILFYVFNIWMGAAIILEFTINY